MRGRRTAARVLLAALLAAVALLAVGAARDDAGSVRSPAAAAASVSVSAAAASSAASAVSSPLVGDLGGQVQVPAASTLAERRPGVQLPQRLAVDLAAVLTVALLVAAFRRRLRAPVWTVHTGRRRARPHLWPRAPTPCS